MFLPQLSPASVQVVTDATKESAQAQHHFVGIEHLFLGLLEQDRAFERTLSSKGVDLDRFRERLMEDPPAVDPPPWGEDLIYTPRSHVVFQLAGKIAEREGKPTVEPSHILEAILREARSVPARFLRNQGIDLVQLQGEVGRQPIPEDSLTPTLDRFGRDLTALARAGALSPVIGRENEQDLLEQILLRKNKNNPVLVGEAGVGKTAVVEGFAQRLVHAECPEVFHGWRLVEISLGTLVAGTKFRGEFEERVTDILSEVQDHPGTVLFLDEIHTLVGAGSTSSDSLDASNMLKPALARGEIRVIGATTIPEYRMSIEKDAALDRRFDQVRVEEPSREDALEIMRAVQKSFETHHGVRIEWAALEAAVDLTIRHCPDRNLPDKALDAVDQSCARHRLQVLREDRGGDRPPHESPVVRQEDIIRTVSQWTGIPLERMTTETARSLLNLERRLRERVLGQDAAVKAVARSVMTARAGLSVPDRPIGVFLFLGPTGVGKTELAKALCDQLFGDEKRLIRFDMSEYAEAHAAAKLIGAPPGYVGYEQEGLLISAVRTYPHCVVLFDEVEKAHPKLFDLFLQIFDEGRLSGSHGEQADFTQAIVIMTSNLDPHADEGPKVGFKTDEELPGGQVSIETRKLLAQSLRPELVNRIDEILSFSPLGTASLRGIIDHYLKAIESQLEDRQVELRLDEDVYSRLIEMGESEQFGARELRRVVDHEIRQPLAERLLRSAGDSGRINVRLVDGKIELGS